MGLTTVVQTIGDLDVSPGSGFICTFLHSFHQPGMSTTIVQTAGGPVITQVVPGQYRLSPLQIKIDTDTVPQAEWQARQVDIFRALDTEGGTKAIVISDVDGSSPRYMMFITESLEQLPEMQGFGFVATLTVDEEIRWRGVDAITDVHTVTSSPDTWDINVEGHLDALPTIKFTPRAARSGFGYPNMKISVVATTYPSEVDKLAPIELTNGGWDTAALVTAGDLTQPENILVLNQFHRFIPYWYGAPPGQAAGFNSTTTKIWVNHIETEAKTNCAINEYLSASDPAETLSVSGTIGSPQGWLKFADSDEVISYNGVQAGGLLMNVKRGVADTPVEDHDAGELLVTARPYYIVYGPTAAIPESRKDSIYQEELRRQPLIDMATSTNYRWRQSVFRSGVQSVGWNYAGARSRAFTSPSSLSGDPGVFEEPWTAMGFRHDISGHDLFTNVYNRAIKEVRVQGRAFGFGADWEYPGEAKLEAVWQLTGARVLLLDSGAHVDANAFDVTTYLPTPDQYPEDWTTADPAYTRLIFSYPGTNNVQVDITWIEVAFADWQVPGVTFSGGVSKYDMDIIFRNMTRMERLDITALNIDIDSSLVIESGDHLVTHSVDNSSRYSSVSQPDNRTFLMSLSPGLNSFRYDEDGVTEMDVEISYHPRYYA